jgi:hypothetical protein
LSQGSCNHRARLVIRAILPLLLCTCSDGATRIAYDIESGVAAFQRSEARTALIRHVPKASPDGCAGAYTVQFTANSALVIWCKTADGSAVQGSHITTYHLRFVDVPKTYKLDKGAGEATIIELAKENGKVVVTAVR